MMQIWSHLWHEQYFWLLTFFGLLTVKKYTMQVLATIFNDLKLKVLRITLVISTNT